MSELMYKTFTESKRLKYLLLGDKLLPFLGLQEHQDLNIQPVKRLLSLTIP